MIYYTLFYSLSSIFYKLSNIFICAAKIKGYVRVNIPFILLSLAFLFVYEIFDYIATCDNADKLVAVVNDRHEVLISRLVD